MRHSYKKGTTYSTNIFTSHTHQERERERRFAVYCSTKMIFRIVLFVVCFSWTFAVRDLVTKTGERARADVEPETQFGEPLRFLLKDKDNQKRTKLASKDITSDFEYFGREFKDLYVRKVCLGERGCRFLKTKFTMFTHYIKFTIVEQKIEKY